MTNPKGKYNAWIKIRMTKLTKIDEISFEENTDLDNLIFFADSTEIKKGIPLYFI